MCVRVRARACVSACLCARVRVPLAIRELDDRARLHFVAAGMRRRLCKL
jgi:hypothetical protein